MSVVKPLEIRAP